MLALAPITLLVALAAGEQAALELRDLGGRAASLEDYRGRIVVLNFWATWCKPCVAEMPLLNRLHQNYGARGVEFVAASADEVSTQSRIPRFLRRHKISFPVWVGATVADMRRLDLGEALPATAVLDRDGQIAFRIFGAVDAGDLQERLDWLLGDRSGPQPSATVNTLGKHGEEEEHEHAAVSIEGASMVPS